MRPDPGCRKVCNSSCKAPLHRSGNDGRNLSQREASSDVGPRSAYAPADAPRCKSARRHPELPSNLYNYGAGGKSRQNGLLIIPRLQRRRRSDSFRTITSVITGSMLHPYPRPQAMILPAKLFPYKAGLVEGIR
jgi:hypothetical protein